MLFYFPIQQEQLAIPDGAFARDDRDTCWHKGHNIVEDWNGGMMAIAFLALGGIAIQGELNSTGQGRKLPLAGCVLGRDGNVRGAFSHHEASVQDPNRENREDLSYDRECIHQQSKKQYKAAK